VIVLIVGPDAASARAETELHLRQHDPGGLNTTRVDGKTISIDEAISAVSTPSFFGGSRVIIIDDLMARASKGGSGDDGEPAASAKGFAFAKLFESVADGNVLILVDQTLGSVPAAVKKVAPPEARIFGGEPPRGADLISWLQRQAEKSGSSIDNRTARLLADRTFPQTWTAKPSNPAYDRPPDLDRLRNEIDKLALAAHPNAITAAIVETMVASAAEDRLFPFVEAVVTSRIADAIPALESFQASGEDAGRLIAQVFQHVELAAALPSSGSAHDPAAIGKDLGLSNPNRMHGVAKTARRSRIAPLRMIRIALDTDRKTKRGALRHGDDVLYHLVTAEMAPPDESNNERGGT
jgi:DNA polymerase III delta subunit